MIAGNWNHLGPGAHLFIAAEMVLGLILGFALVRQKSAAPV